MPTDLTIILSNRPGTIADASQALGNAGINIDGFCGFPCEGVGVFHVLVNDAAAALRAAQDAGFEVRDEREVVVVDIEDRPGALGELARRIADRGVNVDLVYLATNTRVVVGGDDLDGVRAAL